MNTSYTHIVAVQIAVHLTYKTLVMHSQEWLASTLQLKLDLISAFEHVHRGTLYSDSEEKNCLGLLIQIGYITLGSAMLGKTKIAHFPSQVSLPLVINYRDKEPRNTK